MTTNWSPLLVSHGKSVRGFCLGSDPVSPQPAHSLPDGLTLTPPHGHGESVLAQLHTLHPPCPGFHASGFCLTGSYVNFRSLKIPSSECQLHSSLTFGALSSLWYSSYTVLLFSFGHFSPPELALPKGTVAMLS